MSTLKDYSLLGNSGLRVSPLCLGTMTFGTEWGWGSPAETSAQIFNAYIDAGGNFVDTADGYTNGTSEELVGTFIKERGLRDQVVLATKYTFGVQPGNPNAGGNGRKNLYRAVELSLKRMKTDYIDLYWVHAWDGLTPVEEVMHSLNTLVEQGKIRYIGLSDCPAWYVSRAQTMAELRGWEKVAALQMEYNLVERTIEREYVTMAQQLGMGICPWSPLASGLLSGKHTKAGLTGRLKATAEAGNPVFSKYTKHPKNWEIVEVLNNVAQELGKPVPQVALNWITKRPGVTSTLIGASRLDQLEVNMKSLEFDIPATLSARLEAVSAPEENTPYTFFQGTLQQLMTGGTQVTKEPRWFR